MIEALVAVAVAGIGLTAALGAMRAISNAEWRTMRSEAMQRLAVQKYDEVVATGEISTAPLEGTFEDRGIADYRWRAEVEPSGVENLDIVTVTVELESGTDDLESSISGLQYVPVVTTDGGTQ